eukprot:Clim_evm4s62 gene=Clim_evmTU4s62
MVTLRVRKPKLEPRLEEPAPKPTKPSVLKKGKQPQKIRERKHLSNNRSVKPSAATKKKPLSKRRSRSAVNDPGPSNALTGAKYYLMKSEPEARFENGTDVSFPWSALLEKKDQTEHWDGVRNHAARNIMIGMQVGEKAFFYHSNCKVPHIAGIVEIVREAYPDHTQFDATSPYYDPKAKKDSPTWKMVDVKAVRPMKRSITLPELKLHKENNGPLSKMQMLNMGRLSVSCVTPNEWSFILSLEDEERE